ncbi:MAG: SRPBCC domain-containing protein [Chloroflexi bacterium]|nr:SRPBCC domain-containing protein [Chloroflexota bacterium]
MFDAPRELVWKAWTDPERLVQWWGPKGFTLTSARLDLRPGGVFHYSMQPPQGAKIWATFVYREVDAPERLAWVVSFSDEQGGMRRNPWIATWPLEVLSMMTLFPVEEKTALMMSSVPINASEEECKAFEAGRNGMQGGFKGTFDQLDAYLAKGK